MFSVPVTSLEIISLPLSLSAVQGTVSGFGTRTSRVKFCMQELNWELCGSKLLFSHALVTSLPLYSISDIICSLEPCVISSGTLFMQNTFTGARLEVLLVTATLCLVSFLSFPNTGRMNVFCTNHNA